MRYRLKADGSEGEVVAFAPPEPDTNLSPLVVRFDDGTEREAWPDELVALPSKFASHTDELVYRKTLDGMHDGEVGDVDNCVWNGLVEFGEDEQALRGPSGAVGGIVKEFDDGRVDVFYYTSMGQLAEAWNGICDLHYGPNGCCRGVSGEE